MSTEELIEKHFERIDDIIFGNWSADAKNPTRNRGLIERVGSIEFMLKICIVGILVADFKGLSLGAVTEVVSHVFAIVGLQAR